MKDLFIELAEMILDYLEQNVKDNKTFREYDEFYELVQKMKDGEEEDIGLGVL